MLIAIDASRANKKNKTGVEWYSYYLIEEFKKLDRDNHYFLYTDKPLEGDLGKMPENFEEKVLKWPLPRFWTVGRLTLQMIFGKRPDVLFVPAHTLPLIVPKRAVVTIHDIGFEHFPEAYHWADKLYHKLIIKIIKPLASKILTVSNYSKKDIVKTYRINEDKVDVVFNGYDNERYKVLPEQPRLVEDPYMLFIGRLELKKNIPRLVEAFGKFKQRNPDSKHKLVLIGTKGLTFPLVEKQIEKFNLADEIIMPGWVEDDDLPKYLNQAELFVFPSLFEGFGIPVIEAMACGCPVICSNTTSLPEAAGFAAQMFDPEQVHEIVGAMEKVLLDSNFSADLKMKGLNQVEKFSWRKCATETLAHLVKNK